MKCLIIMLLILSCSAFSRTATDTPPKAQEKPRIYVVAVTTENKRDLKVENKAKEELKKRQRPVAASQADATHVLVITSEYVDETVGLLNGGGGILSSETVLAQLSGLLVPAAAYTSGKGDLDKLREQAVWQGSVSKGHFSGASVGKLLDGMIGSGKK